MDEKRELNKNKDTIEKFWLLGPLDKLYNILVHSYSQSALKKEFIVLTRRIVPLNNHTRQNNQYLCLNVALNPICETAIDIFTKNYQRKLKEDFITLEEWKKLYTIREFLKPFRKAILNT